MILSHVFLTQFRNITGAEIDFAPGVNVLWGDNAQGKSNILEAIYYCARGRSFRGAAEKQMIQTGTEFASFGVTYKGERTSRPETLSFSFLAGGRKLMERDGIRMTSLMETVGRLHAILFTPQHLSIVSGSPAERRAFMDVAIAMCYPPYIPALSAYKRNLEQRNALLRDTAADGRMPDMDLFAVYTRALADTGAVVASIRADFVRRLGTLAAEQMTAISHGRDSLTLRYVPSGAEVRQTEYPITRAALGGDTPDGEYAQTLCRRLTEDIRREILLKTTLHGPHRDDIEIELSGMPARGFASQGQTRSIALAMKLSEGALSRMLLGEKPVYLLDDVLSELDEGRRGYLLRELSEEQLIITSCEPDLRVRAADVQTDFCRIRVSDGNVLTL